MKILVVYYSRTGYTRIVAKQIAQSLHADLLELKEQTNRRGIRGFIKGGYDALRHNPTKLMPLDKKSSAYDLVITGSPVWAGTLCPAMRTFLQKNAPFIKQVAFFCTHGGGGASKSYADVKTLIGKHLVATMALRDKAVRCDNMSPAIDDFLRALSNIL